MQALLEKKQFSAEVSKNIFAVFDEDQTNQVEFGEFVDLTFYVNELEYLNFKFMLNDFPILSLVVHIVTHFSLILKDINTVFLKKDQDQISNG